MSLSPYPVAGPVPPPASKETEEMCNKFPADILFYDDSTSPFVMLIRKSVLRQSIVNQIKAAPETQEDIEVFIETDNKKNFNLVAIEVTKELATIFPKVWIAPSATSDSSHHRVLDSLNGTSASKILVRRIPKK